MTMQNTKRKQAHTPGPWVINGRLEIRAFGLVARVNEHMTEPGEVEANAAIIAAAPELLGALRKAEKLFQTLVVTHGVDAHPAFIEVLYSVQEAIASAEGRT